MQTSAFSGSPAPLTLSQFARAVGDTIRSNPQIQGVWIVAELSDVRVSGGHCYMELLEKDARGAVLAKMRAVIWASALPSLRARFCAATGQDIRSGIKVMVRGSATHHNVYGFSVQVSDIDPSYTLGDMERIRREILARLQREGIINDNRQFILPEAPQRIAIVSADGAAGYGDFMKQLDGNQFGFRFHTRLFPAVMQGERTAMSVRAALSEVERTLSMWDCVVIVRGGGATSDLNGFDDYELARTVALFPIPVLVGIGHERDRTVLDEIANTRLKTPTAVGAFLVDRLAEAWDKAVTLARQAADFATERVAGDRLRLSHIGATLPMVARARLADTRLTLSRIGSRLPALASGRTAAANAALDAIPRMLASAVAARMGLEHDRISRLSPMITDSASARLTGAADRLKALSDVIQALSPEATLRRGYSVTRIGGKAVRSATQLAPGQTVTTLLADGEFTATVNSISN